MAGVGRVEAALDEFAPDLVIVFGDDQYENFHEDLIPPFAVLAYRRHGCPAVDVDEAAAWAATSGTNPTTWSSASRVPRDIGRHLITQLLAAGFDMPYAYRPLHQDGLSHSFLNALLLLDHERRGSATRCYRSP